MGDIVAQYLMRAARGLPAYDMAKVINKHTVGRDWRGCPKGYIANRLAGLDVDHESVCRELSDAKRPPTPRQRKLASEKLKAEKKAAAETERRRRSSEATAWLKQNKGVDINAEIHRARAMVKAATDTLDKLTRVREELECRTGLK